jgi:GxxExxY protein
MGENRVNDLVLPKLENDSSILYKEEVYKIVGAAMEVYNQLGCGFLEAVYQEALGIELTARQIPFVAQPELLIAYKGKVLQKCYIADFVIDEKIIIEIKAIHALTNNEKAQVVNYLKATGLKLALLINFSPQKLEWERIILSQNKNIHK